MAIEVRFPLADVEIRKVSEPRRVIEPLYTESYWQMNQDEFAMQVDGVGSFYACNGSEVEYTLADGAAMNEAELYLNGSVYGAILHQRKILPMHGSCFRHNGIGIMICGDTGAGKSALTASFCLNGAEFLTDDITPVILRQEVPIILAMSDRIKLWGDTLQQLEKSTEGLQSIYRRTEKYYLPVRGADGDAFSLDMVLIIEVGSNKRVEFEELNGAHKLTALRGEIYRPEYLQGMPENEPVYFNSLLGISRCSRIIKVRRPEEIRIMDLHDAILEYMKCLQGEC